MDVWAVGARILKTRPSSSARTRDSSRKVQNGWSTRRAALHGQSVFCAFFKLHSSRPSQDLRFEWLFGVVAGRYFSISLKKLEAAYSLFTLSRLTKALSFTLSRLEKILARVGTMFKSMAADMAGTSDNCTPVRIKGAVADASVAGDSLSFLRHGETPYIFLKSLVFEWIFTNLGLILLERDNAAGVKRTVSRFDWQTQHIELSTVKFVTPGAGSTDYSCSCSFQIGQRAITIDIVKTEMDFAKSTYLAILELAAEQQRNGLMMSEARAILAKTQVIINASDPSAVCGSARELVTQFAPASYGDILERAMADQPAGRV